MKRSLGLLLLVAGCESEQAITMDLAMPTPSVATSVHAQPPIEPPSVEPPSVEPLSVEPGACRAPSLEHDEPFDARTSEALASCIAVTTGPVARAKRCGRISPQPPALDVARLDEGVVHLDEATRAHVRTIVDKGKALGRNPRAFGLVGDSMTVSGAFMRELYEAARTKLAPQIEPQVAAALSHYRGAQIEQQRGVWRDSFRATRAAKIGMRTPWALAGGEQAPLHMMIANQSPAIAIVLFGGNDAAYRLAPPEELADEVERDMTALIDALLGAGIVPVLNTLARHGDAPGFDDCGPRGEMTNWRITVATNAISARVAEIACRRKLPLIDLRHALDAAEGRGLSSDGVHPSSYADGSSVLTARGLRCGYNVRNYVTLNMLSKLLSLEYF